MIGRIAKTASLAAAAVAMTGTALAQKAAAPCLTRSEFVALSGYSLPAMLRGAATRCAPSLAKDAFLKTSLSPLASKYDSRKPATWPAAKSAFLKVGAAMDPQTAAVFKGLPDATLQPLVDDLISGMVVAQLPADRCGSLDRLVMLMSPLPAENMAEIVGVAAGIWSRDGKAKIGKFTVCPVA
jgi:hypothetical protein